MIQALVGSSPLARGLRARPVRPDGHGRIIPARAGFTSSRSPATSRRPDHPRSRGVYRGTHAAHRRKTGSSPLARGLPRSLEQLSCAGGIIPARAGFTLPRCLSRTATEDHPRSRGVYPNILEKLGDALGIIPARAGFTPPPSGRRGPSRDHPRSRGVYYCLTSRSISPCGSSPLARGLRRLRPFARTSSGIIPARAGFTAQGAPIRIDVPDHPRSRGVYLAVKKKRGGTKGSSPLARGLRHGEGRDHRRGGIIPARAGFTCAWYSQGHRPSDHPRSRGVYVGASIYPITKGGSSPLARGLPGKNTDNIEFGRIIPARAGFTLFL